MENFDPTTGELRIRADSTSGIFKKWNDRLGHFPWHELVDDLAARLRPGVLRLGHCFESLEQDGQRVRVTCLDGATGERVTVSSAVAVGCDGNQSAVRAALLGDGPPHYAGLGVWRGQCAKPAGWDEKYGKNLLTGWARGGQVRSCFWSREREREREEKEKRKRETATVTATERNLKELEQKKPKNSSMKKLMLVVKLRDGQRLAWQCMGPWPADRLSELASTRYTDSEATRLADEAKRVRCLSVYGVRRRMSEIYKAFLLLRSSASSSFRDAVEEKEEREGETKRNAERRTGGERPRSFEEKKWEEKKTNLKKTKRQKP